MHQINYAAANARGRALRWRLQGWRSYVEYSFSLHRISGLVVEYIVAIDVTRVRFPADALLHLRFQISFRTVVVQSETLSDV